MTRNKEIMVLGIVIICIFIIIYLQKRVDQIQIRIDSSIIDTNTKIERYRVDEFRRGVRLFGCKVDSKSFGFTSKEHIEEAYKDLLYEYGKDKLCHFRFKDGLEYAIPYPEDLDLNF